VTLNGRKLSTRRVFLSNTSKASSAGLPGLTVPMARTSAGLPLGIEIDGPVSSDRRLLGIGLRLEQVLGPMLAPER
jgi:Asp-tRNA(Asn)/Glu-tRNA(Gln) amidotransferase A subunit family amidase